VSGACSPHERRPGAPESPGRDIREVSPGCAESLTSITVAEAARVLHEAVRDKSYRATPLGQLVGRYLRWARNERGLVSKTTVRAYEYVLARMSVTLAHLEPDEVTLDDLRNVIDFWADREPQTRANATSALRSFWRWAEEEGHVERSPAHRLRRPKLPKKAVELLPDLIDTQLLAAAETQRDRLALAILLDFGIRRSELLGIQVRDIDLARRTLTIFGKGQKHRVLPVRGRVVLIGEEYLLTPLRFLERQPEPDDYLLYSEWRNGSGIYRARPRDPMPAQTAHR
jgi:site-specific recombinase XerD